MPAVEILLNTKLISELIEKGDLSGIKDAMTKSLAEGSRTFEEDIARLIAEGTVSRDEGLAHADSPTNLLWRLENDVAPVSRAGGKKDEPDTATFTEISIEDQQSLLGERGGTIVSYVRLDTPPKPQRFRHFLVRRGTSMGEVIHLLEPGHGLLLGGAVRGRLAVEAGVVSRERLVARVLIPLAHPVSCEQRELHRLGDPE